MMNESTEPGGALSRERVKMKRVINATIVVQVDYVSAIERRADFVRILMRRMKIWR